MLCSLLIVGTAPSKQMLSRKGLLLTITGAGPSFFILDLKQGSRPKWVDVLQDASLAAGPCLDISTHLVIFLFFGNQRTWIGVDRRKDDEETKLNALNNPS